MMFKRSLGVQRFFLFVDNEGILWVLYSRNGVLDVIEIHVTYSVVNVKHIVLRYLI